MNNTRLTPLWPTTILLSTRLLSSMKTTLTMDAPVVYAHISFRSCVYPNMGDTGCTIAKRKGPLQNMHRSKFRRTFTSARDLFDRFHTCLYNVWMFMRPCDDSMLYLITGSRYKDLITLISLLSFDGAFSLCPYMNLIYSNLDTIDTQRYLVWCNRTR